MRKIFMQWENSIFFLCVYKETETKWKEEAFMCYFRWNCESNLQKFDITIAHSAWIKKGIYEDMIYTANMDWSRLICTHSSSYWKRTQNSHWFHLLKNSILPLFFCSTDNNRKRNSNGYTFFMFTIHYESQSLLYVCASIIDWWKIHNDRDDQVWQ